jgi:hypothetical protein
MRDLLSRLDGEISTILSIYILNFNIYILLVYGDVYMVIGHILAHVLMYKVLLLIKYRRKFISQQCRSYIYIDTIHCDGSWLFQYINKYNYWTYNNYLILSCWLLKWFKYWYTIALLLMKYVISTIYILIILIRLVNVSVYQCILNIRTDTAYLRRMWYLINYYYYYLVILEQAMQWWVILMNTTTKLNYIVQIIE